jgi:hypothetical protein
MNKNSIIVLILAHITLPCFLHANVEISFFGTSITNEMNIEFKWITESETGMLGFQVYRSYNEELNNAIQITSELIPATNTSTTQEYLFIDEEVISGSSYYYWLESIDLDLTNVFDGPVSQFIPDFGGGSGTEADPWQIETADHLDSLRQLIGLAHGDKHFLLISDIDLYDATREGGIYWHDGEGWEPIGWMIDGGESNPFCGVFEGNGHIIEGMYINRFADFQGLFGAINGAEISDLKVLNAAVTVGNYMAGVLAGFITNQSVVTNSITSGIVHGYLCVGGLVGGSAEESSIYKCFSTGAVSGSTEVGGLVGYQGYDTTISDSHSNASATGNISIGGLLGSAVNSTVINSFSTGAVTAMGYFGGGLVGMQLNSTVENSYWDIDTSGQTSSDAGEGRTTQDLTYPYAADTFVGWNFSEIWDHDVDYAYNSGYPYLHSISYVSVDEGQTVPASQIKLSNYPNPFNPETTISFTLPELSEVNLTVYNIKGQQVRTLIAGTKYSQGDYQIVWDGRDDFGKAVTSGFYFYRITTSGFASTKKMMMLK